MWGTRARTLPLSDGAVELQALDGHSGPPVGVLRLEHGAEAPPAQVVQVGELLVGDDGQGAGQAADVHTADGRGRLHRAYWAPWREVSGLLSAALSQPQRGELPALFGETQRGGAGLVNARHHVAVRRAG